MYASIDIGTNTVLLLVAEIRNGKPSVLHEEQRIPRLGRGVDASKNLDPDSVERVLDALRVYRELIRNRYPDVSQVAVTATSAVRDAGNRAKFISRVKEETGFDVTVLDGYEEAEYTFAGAMSVLPLSRAAVIDIGGGSTEIALGENGNLLDRQSLDMGSVRFTERYLKQDPPAAGEMEECAAAVRKMLAGRPFERGSTPGKPSLVGVAGTVTSLAYMDAGLDTYRPERLNGYRLPAGTVGGWIERLSGMTAGEIETEYPDVMKGRADVITGGLIILRGFMEYHSFREVTVSTGGIRHGSLLKMAAGNL